MNKPHYKPLTTDQQIENCLLALANWKKVTPKSVDLCRWRCGTHACFGGHLATWPEFQAMGVQADSDDGAPMICTQERHIGEVNVAEHLFGDRELFYSRGYCRDDFGRSDQHKLSDHALVVNRLEAQIVRLTDKQRVAERLAA